MPELCRYHRPDNDVVHVHDNAVTWEHFLENIGITTDPQFIRVEQDLWQNDAANKVSFWLNGNKIDSLRNLIIKSEDRLLINYGAETPAEIKSRFDKVAASAREHNANTDPGNCGGGVGWKIRLRQAIF